MELSQYAYICPDVMDCVSNLIGFDSDVIWILNCFLDVTVCLDCH